MKNGEGGGKDRLLEMLQEDTIGKGEDMKTKIKHFKGQILQPVTDKKYKGQTPLHLAICKERDDIVKEMIEKLEVKDWEKICATGKEFKTTAMLGEIPLSVAALTLNTGKYIHVHFKCLIWYSGYITRLSRSSKQQMNITAV